MSEPFSLALGLQRFVLLFVFFITGCESNMESGREPREDWVTYKAGEAFTFRGPPSLKYKPERRMDSFVGTYEGQAFRLEFDYGWYSSLSLEGDWTGEWIEVDGRRAYVASGPGVVGVHVPKVDEHNKLTMIVTVEGLSSADFATMMQSIKFVKRRP